MGANTVFRKRNGFRTLWFALCFLPAAVWAQSDSIKPSFSVGFAVQRGFIIPHSESIRSISNSNPYAFEANFSWHFRDVKAQSYCNCFPRAGISLMYINFDNPEILGRGYTLAPYVEPFIALAKKWDASVRFSAGAAYLDNIYHPENNPENLFYSTHFSYILTLNVALNYQALPHWSLRLTGNYNHISNGGNKQPNKGINFPTVALGVDYIFKPVEFTKASVYQDNIGSSKNSIRAVLLGTGKTSDITGKRKLLYGVNVTYGRKISRMSNFTAGTEYVNDATVKESVQTGDNSPDHKRISALVGHELEVGKFRFSQQLGVYIYSPAKAKDPVYQRWGLDFYFNRHIFTGLNLKAHRHVADFLDFRIGYVW